jgi:hypothetical protein
MSGIFDQIINYSPPLIVSGPVNYKGTWNASTNNPTLNNPPAVSTKGDYYVVSTAGTQFSITFGVGDWIISNGTAWEKVDLTDAVSSVFGRTGAVVGVSTDYSAVGITNTAIGASSPSTGAFTTVSASTPIAVASGGTGVTTSTGSGSNVLSTSPTLTTPISASLTSPAASNLTLGTGTFGTALTFTSATGAATFAGRTLVGSATGTLGARFEVNELSDTIAIFVRGAGQTNGVGLGTSGTNQPFVNGYSNVGAVTALGIQPNGGALSIGNSATITTINGTTASTSTTTGSLINAGGFGNVGAAYIGGPVSTGSRFVFTGPGALPGASELAIGTNGVGTRILSNVPTGGEFNFTVNGTTVTAINATTGLYTTGLINSTNTTASTSTTTGSLVNAGGFGNAGAIFAGSTIASTVSTSGGGVVNFAPANSAAIASGNTANIHFSTYASDANTWQLTARQNSTTPTDKTLRVILGGVAQHTYFNASDLSTQSGIQMKVLDTTTSTSTTTGSLVNAGGFGNAGAAFIGGNATVFGAAGITINNVGGSGNDSILTLTQSGVSNAFIKNTATTGDIAIGDGGGTYLRITKGAGVVFVSNTTASSSTTTGSLVNAGGFGCAGAAYFGGAIAIGNTVNTVSPTSPNRTVTIVIGGTTYYLHAKTTND